jgi:putative MATE family efflux protein
MKGVVSAPDFDDGPPGAGLWSDLRASLAGGERDWTRMEPRRAVLLLAVPMMLEMVLESVFAVVDIFYVARLGPAAIATVGLTEAMMTLLFAVAIGLATATTALVARRVGEGDLEGAAETAVQALALGLLVSLAIGGVGALAARRLLAAMGASGEVLAVGSSYATIMLGGCASVVLLFLGNAVFRGAGDPAVAIRVLWTSNLVNLALDPCLIFGLGPFPELGVTGAAVATTIGRTVGVAILVKYLFEGRSRVRLRPGLLRLRWTVMAGLLRVSAGGILQYLAETGAWLALVRVLALFGEAALAGYTVAIRIVLFTFLPSWGLSNAAATLVGQNLGAGRPEEAERSVWLTARYNVAFLGSVGLLFLAVPGPLLRPFTRDPEVLAVAVECLRWLGACYGFFAFGLVTIQAFNGAGDTATPMRLKLLWYWLWQIPVAWLLAVEAELGPRGVFVAIASAEVLLAASSLVLFRRGRWKEKVV